VNAEAGQDNAVARDQDRDGFGRRDVRIELEIDARPAVKMAWDIGPFFDRAEAVAHGGKVGASPHESSEGSEAETGRAGMHAKLARLPKSSSGLAPVRRPGRQQTFLTFHQP
jgi:hypothetical protein